MPFITSILCKMPNGKLERYDLNRIAFQAAETFQPNADDGSISDFYTWLTAIANHKCVHCKQDHSSMCCPTERCYHCNKFGHWDYICPDPDYAVENPYYKALDYAAEVAALDEKEWLECNLVPDQRYSPNHSQCPSRSNVVIHSQTPSPSPSPKHYNSEADSSYGDESNSDTESNADSNPDSNMDNMDNIEPTRYATKLTKCQITIWFA